MAELRDNKTLVTVSEKVDEEDVTQVIRSKPGKQNGIGEEVFPMMEKVFWTCIKECSVKLKLKFAKTILPVLGEQA